MSSPDNPHSLQRLRRGNETPLATFGVDALLAAVAAAELSEGRILVSFPPAEVATLLDLVDARLAHFRLASAHADHLAGLYDRLHAAANRPAPVLYDQDGEP